MRNPLQIKSCHLAILATGHKANDLKQLHALLEMIPESSLYTHFWAERLRPSFTPFGFHNDFARWAHFSLHDQILAERLSIINPLEEVNLREKLIEVIEQRLKETTNITCGTNQPKFHFLQSELLTFETGITIYEPKELKNALVTISPTSIFYHLIQAKTIAARKNDDFICWLQSQGIEQIAPIDVFFLSLNQIKVKLMHALEKMDE